MHHHGVRGRIGRSWWQKLSSGESEKNKQSSSRLVVVRDCTVLCFNLGIVVGNVTHTLAQIRGFGHRGNTDATVAPSSL